MILIREATTKDAKLLVELKQQTFRDTFEGENEPGDMDIYCERHFNENIQRSELESNQFTLFICECEGETSGYAQIHWQSDTDSIDARNPAEIQRFYILKQWHGKGVAKQLMKVCLEEIANHLCDIVWLGVWEHNQRAIAFYQKYLFNVVGNKTFTLGTDHQNDFIMSRRLT